MQQADAVNQTPNTIELKSCSSLNMYRVLKKLNKFTELYLDCSMAHGLDDCVKCGNPPVLNRRKTGNSCEDCSYESTFGSTATDRQTTIKYMAGRIAVFSQTLMASATPLIFNSRGTSFFKDCENTRKCTQTNYTTCGGADTLCNDDLLDPETE